MSPPHYWDQYEFPLELCAKPLALIGFTGLNTLNNAVHKSIWNAFNGNRRAERPPINLKLLGNAHEFPVIKPKRNSYEWYIPKGILKRNWMHKHLNEIPAVVVVFYDLDWNDEQWNEKMIECSSRVQSIRAALEGRNTRITIVLIQQTLPLPVGEDVLASERASALCASSELNAKSLFVLPLGDHLQGYSVRLETAFYDLAQNYYHHEARNIKSHKDHLHKTTHQFLFVRHQFKMGFLNELKQDNHTAHKHYNHAYNNLLDLRIVDTNALEIKTVAGFMNYKLCRLMFILSLPRDAISQFRTHVDRFKSQTGFRELAFEHYAWLSKQFTVFGDLFDEAVKLGLPAVQTQHPGFYYQQAAQHAILRKQACQELCQNVTEYPVPDPLQGLEMMEFYGQRPWRPGKLSAEQPDPHKEQNGFHALQFLEKGVNHSNLIISYFGLAISQFKTYRCPRMRRHLVVQMADEYYYSKDYGKALTLLTHMLWDYRSEKWWHLISDILKKALRCAYLSANIQDYITLSLEMLSEHTTVALTDKTRIFENMNNILKKLLPVPESLSETEITTAQNLWTAQIEKEPFCISIDMSNITSCIDSKARFVQSKYEADQNVMIEVYIRSTCPYLLHFTYLSVTVNTPNYSSEFAVSEGNVKDENVVNPSLAFECNQVKRFLVDFLPDVQDVGQEIQIGSIILHLGHKHERYAILRFTSTGSNNRNNLDVSHFRSQSQCITDFDNIKPLGVAHIVSRSSKMQLDIEHEQPALVGEWYLVQIKVTNAEMVPVKNVQASIMLEIDEVGNELATEFSSTTNTVPEQLPLQLQFPDLNVNETASSFFYVRSHRTGDRNVTLRFSYLFDTKKKMESVKDIIINIPVTKPFDISTKFYSKRFETISKFYVDELFVIMQQIRCTSPWPIVIENTVLELSSYVKSLDGNLDSQLVGSELRNEELGAEVFAAGVSVVNEQPIQIGQYTVFWKRPNSIVTNSTQASIKGLSVDEVPLLIETVLPAHGFVRTPMPVSFELHNHSVQLIQLDMTMDASEAFMFAGYKQIQVSILPKSVKILKYNLYPLIPGNVALPKFKLVINEKNVDMDMLSLDQQKLVELLDRCLPTHVYIMPQVKGNPVSAAMTEITTTLVQ